MRKACPMNGRDGARPPLAELRGRCAGRGEDHPVTGRIEAERDLVGAGGACHTADTARRAGFADRAPDSSQLSGSNRRHCNRMPVS